MHIVWEMMDVTVTYECKYVHREVASFAIIRKKYCIRETNRSGFELSSSHDTFN